MNLKQLRYFLAVAEEKQITAAAKRLFIAQPPLSYQLKQLEKELDVRLFIRTSHGIELTDAGQELRVYAEKILNLVDAAKDQVQKMAQGELGTIKIGSESSSVGELPSLKFKELTKYYPDISFDVYEDNTFGVLEKLSNGTIDLGIVRTPFKRYGIDSKTITNEKMMAVTTNEIILKQGAIDLPTRTAILWAKRGLGLALVPEKIATLYAKDNFIPVEHVNWETHLQLVWRKGVISPLVKRIIELF